MRLFYKIFGITALIILTIPLAGCQGTRARLREAESHYEYGLLYLETGKYNLARIEFQRAAQLHPEDPRVYNGLGLVYYLQGQFSQAIIEYQKAIDLDSDYAEVYNNIAAAYAKKEQWPQVLEYTEKALAITTYLTPELAHYNRGVAYYHLKKYDQARFELVASLEFEPNYVDTHYQLGLTLLKLKLYDQAAKSFQMVLQLLPMSKAAREAREEKEAQPRGGEEKDPLLVGTHYYLGLSLLYNKQKDEASKEFNKVIELSPDSKWAKEAQQALNNLKMK